MGLWGRGPNIVFCPLRIDLLALFEGEIAWFLPPEVCRPRAFSLGSVPPARLVTLSDLFGRIFQTPPAVTGLGRSPFPVVLTLAPWLIRR